MSTLTKTVQKYNALKTVQTVRRARRAYVGLHSLAFEKAQNSAKHARTLTENLFADLVVKGEVLESKAVVAAKDVQDKAEKTYADTAEKVRGVLPEVKFTGKTRADVLEAEVELLSTKLDTLKKAPKAKKASAAKKVKAVEGIAADKYTDYIADVQGYDADADVAVIKKIVNYCGIALASRDGKFVACSDETERNTVRDSLLVKKFGLKDEQSELDALVMSVCETMQKDRFKNRVTFYYLLAKSEKMLGKF